VTSAGSRGDSHDKASPESVNGLYKTEVIRKDGPWCGLDEGEHATSLYIAWFTDERLHGELGTIAPTDVEAAHYHEGAPALRAVSH